jgi:hypothetical protein
MFFSEDSFASGIFCGDHFAGAPEGNTASGRELNLFSPLRRDFRATLLSLNLSNKYDLLP